jgi:uncharacterized protein (DUF1697 family)
MALVVFLKGVNVGGYRKFRPSLLAQQLKRYDVVNIGAAGTLVVRKPVTQAKLRAELKRRLPFQADIMICSGGDILRLAATNPFANQQADRGIIQFVSVLSKRPSPPPPVPLSIPPDGDWGLRILKCDKRFVLGVHRREMKAIGYLGQIDKIVGASATTRSWSTIQTIARILQER